MDRRTLTMNWDGLAEHDHLDEDVRFFESFDRLSSASAVGSSGSDEDEQFEDSRLSFTSAFSSASRKSFHGLEAVTHYNVSDEYELWMAEPGDIKERRRRLLQGMGLMSSKELLKLASAKFIKTNSIKVTTNQHFETTSHDTIPSEELKHEPSPTTEVVHVRSRSDGDILSFSANTKKRKEELIGPISKQRLTRTSSGLVTSSSGMNHFAQSETFTPKRSRKYKSSMANSEMFSSISSTGELSSFFLIKNLDTGKEFIVKEYNEEGAWNKLSDLQTGKQLTMEEFEKSVGYSPVVKELMRRENGSRANDEGRKVNVNSYLSKSFRYSKRRGVALLKNIKGVANSMSGIKVDKEKEVSSPPAVPKPIKNASKWVKSRQHGKSYKEFTALHMSQEIQAHEGSIWTIKFSYDSRYLASAGEDKVIHIWEVQECEITSTKPPDDLNSPVHPMASSACGSDRPPLAEIPALPSEKRRKGRGFIKKKGNSIPDYVSVPETVYALSEKPICTFKGHLEDVLDLSWSRSQLLLSASMDKTVRLWDMEMKSCLKLFAHNDYVTSIQFNPIDDDYFISGSLDAKVRIWSLPDRQVVDWTDLNEMVTAACYTSDGQGAIIGSHKGFCRRYTITDSKLEFKDLIEVHSKKKSQAKKITGFEFSPTNPLEVIITSADSRIRICDGSDIIHKFRGFRNTSSQISASFTSDGRYIISASEDSNVYIWKREESKTPGSGKGKTIVNTVAHEHFQCKDVSVAIPWPGSTKHEPPLIEIHSKRHHSKRSIPVSPFPTTGSPTREDYSINAVNSRKLLPPLPRKCTLSDRSMSCVDEDFTQSSRLDIRIDSGVGVSDSFDSAASSSIRFSESPSISGFGGNSPSHTWSFLDAGGGSVGGGSHGANTVQATAWGLGIVTASLGGEIRVYQNFGLPLKVSRQYL